MTVLLLTLVAGCRKDNLLPPLDTTKVPRSMGVFIENNYDLSLLHAALKKTGLLDTLKAGGPFTLFAPDNAAFNGKGIATVADIENMNTDSLRAMMRYHIIRNRYFISSFPLQMDTKYVTLAGENLYITADKGNFAAEARNFFVNGAFVQLESKRNIALANGVIHIISRPLEYNAFTVQDYIARDTSLTLFVAAMKRFNLWDGFKTKNPLTIFAPVNSAFSKYGITAETIAAMNPAAYNPLCFGVYPLSMRPMHVFSTDGYVLSHTNVFGAGSIILEPYSVSPSYDYNWNGNIETAGVFINRRQGIDWIANPQGAFRLNYWGGRGNADHLCANGIVHVIDDLIFNPDLMKQ
ncbi:fasciclin domain-containing protein [Chitinophaga eiseniae]|uniref:Fasciclin domain-containing protein n=1 Tax=Chitinophaga eiseniae TaxID=634771 RepID=A0A847SNK7_9BACT|nr:fasciclin domain-containing protein [Chitinophaga eiseniae]NLR81413.1 fasciclin domain-containing protein [Chitinophaga eiseniae]